MQMFDVIFYEITTTDNCLNAILLRQCGTLNGNAPL
jgi:hypothetical protein